MMPTALPMTPYNYCITFDEIFLCVDCCVYVWSMIVDIGLVYLSFLRDVHDVASSTVVHGQAGTVGLTVPVLR